MKHTRIYDILTDPTADMDAAYHHLSYALFRTDEAFGRVVATRFPSRTVLRVGDTLQTKLALSDEAMSYLLRSESTAAPLFVLTNAGLGLLVKRYDMTAGLGLYLHIHCRPEAGARLLCAGALGQETGAAFSLSRRIRALCEPPRAGDTASFSALLDAWQTVCFKPDYADIGGTLGLDELPVRNGYRRGKDFLPVDDEGRLPARTLLDALMRMAEFVGCELNLSKQCPTAESTWTGMTFPCYRPAVLEAVLLYILTEAKMHAANRRATYLIGVGADGKRPALTLRYPVDVTRLPVRIRNHMVETRQYLRAAADWSGLDVSFPIVPTSAMHPAASVPLSPMQSVTLEWLADPAILPSSDLKARIGLKKEP